MRSRGLLESTYMDDTMDSVTDDKARIKVYCGLSTIWQLAGMHSRKLLYNSTELLKIIPEADHGDNIDITRA